MLALLVAVLVSACSSAAAPPVTTTAGPATTTSTTAATTTSLATTTTLATGSPIEIALRIERHTTDAATLGFEATALAILQDPRGWGRAGFTFVVRPDAPFLLVLGEAAETDQRCLPYDTFGLYSCQNGPTVALNADRWRTATTKWTGTLDDYRRYLVGHEVGHLLGLHHPKPQCPRAGVPARLMSQQSTELDGCLPNPWPLEPEMTLAKMRPATLAPPYEP